MITFSLTTWTRIGALLLACTLVGCGGASSTVNPLSPNRIIAFGDAYSAVDVNGLGTYTVNTGETNTTVASQMASIYGITLKGVAGRGHVLNGRGYSYATGTAKVSDVQTQISDFLADSPSVASNDLIIITAGAQDIFAATPTNNTAAIQTAAANLTAAIQSLTNAGAQYVLVVLPINMGRTPWAVAKAYTVTAQALSYDTSTLCQSFACQLSTKLNDAYPATSSHQRILLADLIGFSNLITGTTTTGGANTFVTYGVANPNIPVCDATTGINGATVWVPAHDVPAHACNATLASMTVVSSASAGYAANVFTGAAWDFSTSVFADYINLTPMGNRLLANYIYSTNMYRAGWR